MAAIYALRQDFNDAQAEAIEAQPPHECRPFSEGDIGRLVVWWVEYKPQFLMDAAMDAGIDPDTENAPQRIVRAYLERQAVAEKPDMALSFVPDRVKNWYEGPHAHLEQVQSMHVVTFIEPCVKTNLLALPFPQA